MTTVSLVGTFVALELIEWTLAAVFLFLGARWAKIPNVSFCRAAGAALAIYAIGAVGAVAGFAIDCATAFNDRLGILGYAVLIVCMLLVSWFLIALTFRARFGRAILAWLPTIIPQVVLAVVAVLLVRPYLFEAFCIPFNSMAPTILGRHWEAPCPRCGSPAFASPESELSRSFRHPTLMVCSKENRAVEVSDPPRVELPGDRLVVNKLIAPRRWDVVVFSLPENPEDKFCKRIVGLPNETVVLREGAVWINGKKQTPPNEIAALQYLSEPDGFQRAGWGTESKPARLGSDEYFVLGDFTARSKDSRLWEQGAPGHPPYAVPASYMVGVATHIYWPPNRCRVLR